MKGPTLLVAPLTAYLAQTSIAQDYHNLLQACDRLAIDPYTGILSGECQAMEDTVLTYVDLDKCLGWGAHKDPTHLYNTKPDSPVNALTPVKK